MKPLISLVIPAYGAESYLPRALLSARKSAAHLPPGEIEIVVGIDPKPGDDSPSAAHRALSGFPAKLIDVHERKLGPLLSRLRSSQLAHGEYLAFLDADDFLEESFFPRLKEVIEKEKPDVIGFSFSIIHRGKKHAYPFFSSFKGSGLRLLKALFLDIGTRGFMWSKCYRREVILSYEGPVLTFMEDFLLNAAILPGLGKAVAIPDRLYVYEESNPDSLTSKGDAGRLRKHASAFAACRLLYEARGEEKGKRLLLSYRLRHRLSLSYAAKRSREAGLTKEGEKAAFSLFKAAMGKDGCLERECPDFVASYRTLPFFKRSPE